MAKTTDDITGMKFNKLTAVSLIDGAKPRRWLCQCECGNTHAVAQGNLTGGSVLSCGCARKRGPRMQDHPLYSRWKGMRQRCNDPSSHKYSRYGGRGIKVCSRWEDFYSFVEDMGLPPSSEMTLDRIDLDGDYCPENCRWATVEQQMNNTSNTHRIEIAGTTKSLTQWCREYKISVQTAAARIATGWDSVRAVTEPARGHI